MDEKTLITLNKLQRGKISYKKACRLLGKSEKEIDKLFDSDEYIYLPTLEDEKRIFDIEEKNIQYLMDKASSTQRFVFPAAVFPKEFRSPIIQSYSLGVFNSTLKPTPKKRDINLCKYHII